MGTNAQYSADLFTFTKTTLNGKLIFYAGHILLKSLYPKKSKHKISNKNLQVSYNTIKICKPYLISFQTNVPFYPPEKHRKISDFLKNSNFVKNQSF